MLPFKTHDEDDAASRVVAQSVVASLTEVLTRAGQQVVSPAKGEKYRGADRSRITAETGSRFIVDGEVHHDGRSMSVALRIEDGRTGRLVMSNVFERPATADVAGFADLVAGYVGVRSWSYTPSAVPSSHPEVEAAGYRIAELLAHRETRAAYDLGAAMARKYPDDPLALMQLVANSTFNYWSFQQDEVESRMRAARATEQRVSKLLPRYGDLSVARSLFVPPQWWTEREALLRMGLALDPDTRLSGHAPAGLLGEVGRLRDAEQLEGGELGRDAFNLEKILRQYTLLRTLGDRAQSDALGALVARFVPGNAEFALRQFMASDFRGQAAEPARLMADPTLASLIEPPERPPRIRQMLAALQSRRPRDIDIAVPGCTPAWVSMQTTVVCLVGLSELGRLDDAFAFALAIYPDLRAATREAEDQHWLRRDRTLFDTTVLYRPELAPMRADARFAALAERIRLLDYWRAGHPPDFCGAEAETAAKPLPICAAIGNP
ncbi:hypothetical protein [Roseateles sp.]|uniref:hypothetical protein n=1 Tax=Roseateles sp. TaxID=1971397 RepID=UPI0032658D91